MPARRTPARGDDEVTVAMGGVVVRSMESRDVPAVVGLEREIFPDPWSRDAFQHEITLGGTAWCRVLLDEDREEVLGYLVAWFVADEVHLGNIAVAPWARRRGLAGRLLAELLAEGRRRGARLVTLEVRRSNRDAQALYRREGFTTVGIRRGYYEKNREDALVMELTLDGGGATPGKDRSD
jgi:ribosomal-protein-alanine N-acetyltransferase